MIAFDPSQFLADPPALVGLFNPLRPDSCVNRCHIADAARHMVDEVRVGDTVYQLRRQLALTFYPYAVGGLGELVAEPDALNADAPNIVGRGQVPEEAFSDWSARLHTRVQTLLAKRDWERTPEETQEMTSLERLIDLPAYHRDAPYRVRQIGTVARRRPVPDRIRWEDGTLEGVSLDQMPPEFASLHAGQRFEAVAVRAPVTGRLLRVVFVSPLPILSAPPAKAWEELPTTADTPPMSWDEII